jgi:phage-related holin
MPTDPVPRSRFTLQRQLAFIAVVLTVIAIAHRIDSLLRMRGYVMTGTTYAIGGLASFWFIERVAQFV